MTATDQVPLLDLHDGLWPHFTTTGQNYAYFTVCMIHMLLVDDRPMH